MSDDIIDGVDAEELAEKAKKDPKSKKWNNPNSRKNLKQYKRKEEDPDELGLMLPELEIENEEEDDRVAQKQADEITVGRKLDRELVKRLVPKRTTLTPAEHRRFRDIVISFLADFKNEEPTASDIDDIFEIAKCEIYDTRLMEAAKNSPDAVINASKASESLNKRKQKAKENLANRRSDRKDIRFNQEVNIVDLVARYDNNRREVERQRVLDMLESEKETEKNLRDIIDKESF